MININNQNVPSTYDATTQEVHNGRGTFGTLSARFDKNEGDLTAHLADYAKLVGYVTPEIFGAIGDGLTDDTTAIQEMFNSDKNIIFMKDAKYLISSPIVDAVGHIVKMGKSSLIASSEFPADEYMVEINVTLTRSNQRRFSYQLTLDGIHVANGVDIKYTIGNKFDLTVFNAPNAVNIGATATAYENIVNCQIESTGQTELIGLNSLRSDNEFPNVFVVNYLTAVVNGGENHYGIVHPWLGIDGASGWETSTCLKETGNSVGANIDYLYADTMRYGIVGTNYSRTHIGSYFIMMATDQVSDAVIKANPHLILNSTNCQVHIGTLKSYLTYEYFKIVDPSYKAYMRIDTALVSNWITNATFSDICFGVSLNSSMTAFAGLPDALRAAFTSGSITVEAVFGAAGLMYFRVIYWGSDKIYYSTNQSPNNVYWRYTTLTAIT